MMIEAKQRRSGIAASPNDERLAPDFRPASRVVGPCTSPGGGWRPISDGRSLPEASHGVILPGTQAPLLKSHQ